MDVRALMCVLPQCQRETEAQWRCLSPPGESDLREDPAYPCQECPGEKEEEEREGREIGGGKKEKGRKGRRNYCS